MHTSKMLRSMLFFFLSLLFSSPFSSSSSSDTLPKGSSLSVLNPNAVAIFLLVSILLATMLTALPYGWMANRDQPVNGRLSKLSLHDNGNLVLMDADQFTVWITNTISTSLVQLRLHNSGNLIFSTSEGVMLWQSFDFPTDTLLPEQPLNKHTKLVSMRSLISYASGSYKLFFDNDNVLRLLFDSPEFTSVFWPNPWLVSWEVGRSTFNNTRIALLDSFGNFTSSDNLTFTSADFGMSALRRLTVDYDGNARIYSRDEEKGTWFVSWQAITKPCAIHGICGSNSLCSYHPSCGRKCSCLPGFEMKNSTDWSYGCGPEFNLSCSTSDSATFIKLSHLDFYGMRAAYFKGELYLKLPRASMSAKEFRLDCSGKGVVQQDRKYVKTKGNVIVKFMLCFSVAGGGVELVLILVWCILIKTHRSSDAYKQHYILAATVFQRFSYRKLKEASQNFKEEIGRGAGGTVYKGILADCGVVAIKRLNDANQGEAEFLAEVSILGKLNHLNLIEMWGYCAEGKQRLLVYKYMEHGSLAQNLSSNSLDLKKRYEIALGTAKALAYIHEECLEWVLHCDVKPQNILLDSDYKPKVSDYGLSKLLHRGDLKHSSFSRIRGTRGYMAPEWVSKKPITSKVDVYSYGIVVLELVTGKSQTMRCNGVDGEGETRYRSPVTWAREQKAWLMGESIDPMMNADAVMEGKEIEIMVEVALKCIEEDRDARPGS